MGLVVGGIIAYQILFADDRFFDFLGSQIARIRRSSIAFARGAEAARRGAARQEPSQ
jgi:hypothetical protein